MQGTAYLIEPIDFEKEEKEIARLGWFNVLLRKFKRTFLLLFVITFFINLLSLLVPIYVITIYDKVVGTRSVLTLTYIFAGMGIAILLEFLLRMKRVKIISYLGARIEALLLIKSFQHVLGLPIGVINSAPVGAQITRLKQFESIREMFTGSLAEAFLDVPFLLFFLAASFVIGGTLGWIPVGLIVIYFIIGCITLPIVQTQVARSGEAKSKNRNFLTELISKHRSLYYNASQDTWVKRYTKNWSAHSGLNFISQNTNYILQTVTQSLMFMAGILTLALGVIQVIEGTLSNGALIALMIIIWRMLSPIQTVFMGMHRLSLVTESFSQINHLAQFKPEQPPSKFVSFYRKFKGDIYINNVAFRYGQNADPVLRKINLHIEPGQVIAVTGPSGSGKSTLLKILLGLYKTQLGVVMLDGLDIRQINIQELRNSIGYVPQETTCFYGTVIQNLSFARPEANLREVEAALDEMGLLEKIKQLPDGLNTRIKASEKHLFSEGVLQQISLARTFLKQTSIYLLDDPSKNLDVHGNKALLEKIAHLKGKATVIIVTHNMDYLKLADSVVIISDGINIANVPPKELMKAKQ